VFRALLPPVFSECFFPLLLSKYTKIRFYRTTITILPLVLHGCATLFLIFRKKNRLRVSKNKVLKKILGPKR